MRERDHLGDPGVDGRIILRRDFKKWERWRALVSTVRNLRVTKMRGIS
jgi:hypothetical protein